MTVTNIFSKLFQNRNQTWTFYAQLAKLFTGLAFIGLLARSLPSEMLGTWYVFVSLFGVTSLLEMGIGQVIGRHAAYLKTDFELGRISSVDFLKFTKIGERFYFVLAFCIGLIAAPAGLWWFGYQHAEWNMPMVLTISWLIYVCGGLLGILANYQAALLNGSGQMWKTQRAVIYAACVSIMILLLVFVLPVTLITPAAAMLFSQLFLLLLLRKAFFSLEIIQKAVLLNEVSRLETKKTVLNISRDAVKMFLIMVYYHLLTNGFVLILSKHLGHQQIGSYGLGMQLIAVVMSISMIWSQSNFFEMASKRQGSDLNGLRKIFLGGLLRALTVAFIGMLGLYFVAPYILSIMGSQTSLLDPTIFAIILVAIWIEFSLTQFMQMLIALGEMRIAYFSLIGAIMICVAATYLLANGYTLIDVFIARIFIYVICIGIPVLVMAKKTFTNISIGNRIDNETA